MNLESNDFDQKFSEVLKPIKDAAHSFDVDIESLISEYQDSIINTGKEYMNERKINFNEAAFILRYSADVYGKKVDNLHQNVLDFMNEAKTIKKGKSKDEINEGKVKLQLYDEVPTKSFSNPKLLPPKENYRLPLFITNPLALIENNPNYPIIDDPEIGKRCFALQLFGHEMFICDVNNNSTDPDDSSGDDYETDNISFINNEDKILNKERNKNNLSRYKNPYNNEMNYSDGELEPLIDDIYLQTRNKKENNTLVALNYTSNHISNDHTSCIDEEASDEDELDPNEDMDHLIKKEKFYLPVKSDRMVESVHEDLVVELLRIFIPDYMKFDFKIPFMAWMRIHKILTQIEFIDSKKLKRKLSRELVCVTEDNFDENEESEEIAVNCYDGIVSEQEALKFFENIFPNSNNDIENIEKAYKKSFEEMNLQQMDRYMKKSQDVIIKTVLGEAVSSWEKRILPLLEEESTRRIFDIHVYAKEIIEKLVNLSKIKQIIPFDDLVTRMPKYEVTRYFSAILLLVNFGNVEILSDAGSMQIRLLDANKADYVLAQQ